MAEFHGPFRVNAPTTEYTITGLTPGKNYVAMVRTNCGGGNNSNYVEVNGSTAFANQCPVPGLIAVTDYWEAGVRKIKVVIQGSGAALSYNYYLNNVLQINTNLTTQIFVITGYTAPTILVSTEAVCSALLKSPKANLNYVLTTPSTDPGTAFSCPVPSFSVLPGSEDILVSVSPNSTTSYRYEIETKVHEAPDDSWVSSGDIDPVVSGYSHDVTGLVPGTTYDIRVRMKCQNPANPTEFATSGWSTTTVSTSAAPYCMIPTYVDIIGVGSTSANFTWAPAENGHQGTGVDLGYNIKLTRVSDGHVENYTAGGSDVTYNFTGLNPITSYTVQIQTKCADGSLSLFTNPLPFATSESGGGGGGGDT